MIDIERDSPEHDGEMTPGRAALRQSLQLIEGTASAARVEGLLSALYLARKPPAESVWFPIVLGSSTEPARLLATHTELGDLAERWHEQNEELSKLLLEVVNRAYDEVAAATLENPAACLPPPGSEERREYCRGLVEGLLLIDEPPRNNLEAQSLVVNLAVLGGLFPFEEMQFLEPKTESEWREHIEQHIEEVIWALFVKILEGQGKADSSAKKISRNAFCPCGSGRKYKKCCGAG
jgi:hypothetical protein